MSHCTSHYTSRTAWDAPRTRSETGLPKSASFIEDTSQAVQLFDFSERTYTTESMHVEQADGAQLVVSVIGDALIEPFWSVA
jgi:hypothetical protein